MGKTPSFFFSNPQKLSSSNPKTSNEEFTSTPKLSPKSQALTLKTKRHFKDSSRETASQDGLVVKAEELFLEMKGAGICPDVVVCGSLMHDGYCLSGMIDDGRELFVSMAAGKLETAWDLF
ncbi:hypothetical protein OIU76_006797 [Salix suchowensis]|nr:hypothetical protein OIU76_006797 [Salix suchowensis]